MHRLDLLTNNLFVNLGYEIDLIDRTVGGSISLWTGHSISIAISLRNNSLCFSIINYTDWQVIERRMLNSTALFRPVGFLERPTLSPQ